MNRTNKRVQLLSHIGPRFPSTSDAYMQVCAGLVIICSDGVEYLEMNGRAFYISVL